MLSAAVFALATASAVAHTGEIDEVSCPYLPTTEIYHVCRRYHELLSQEALESWDASMQTDQRYQDGNMLPSAAWNFEAEAAMQRSRRVGSLIATLDSGPISITIKPGQGAGGNHAFGQGFNINVRPRGIILAFEVRFQGGFEWGCRGKVGGLFIGPGAASGGNNSPDGASARLMWDANGGAYAYTYVPTGTQHLQPPALRQTSSTGASPFKYHFRGVLTTNKWHRVEIGVYLNDPGQQNGRLMLNIDGREQEMGGAMWRVSGGHAIERARFAVFHGGGCSATRQSSMALRNIQIFNWNNN